MDDERKHEMALDMLRYHLGMSKEEAQAELGIRNSEPIEQQVIKTQSHISSKNAQ
ncbi:hypothetical protein [Vibrio rarus]|uniref:hypothetical protein n=1 Tax=Vibrio rarus TaxID=413403 RepID=UPI0021C31A6C|nr:hypothetical protein [Vibrio rarus]